jgi:hypothetical protein
MVLPRSDVAARRELRAGMGLPGEARPCPGTSLKAYKPSSVPFRLIPDYALFEPEGAGELDLRSPTLALWLFGAFWRNSLTLRGALPCLLQGALVDLRIFSSPR